MSTQEINVHNEAVLEVSKAYTLKSPVGHRSKDKAVLDTLIGTDFVYIGGKNSKNQPISLFKSLVNGQQYLLLPALFLDSDRFYYAGVKRTKTDIMAIICNHPVTLRQCYSENTVNVKAGTIFSKYRKVTGNSYIVTTNNGKEYYLPVHTTSQVVDIEGESPTVANTAIIPDSKSEVQEKQIELLEKEASESLVTIEQVCTFRVKGLDFSTKQEAEAALRMYQHLQG